MEARDLFARAIAEDDAIDAHEGLADASWWLCEARESVEHRERVFVLAKRDGDPVRAGRAAIDLSVAYLLNLGSAAAARGWLAKAERVTEDLDPNPLRGWIWLMQAYLGSEGVDPVETLQRTIDHARATEDSDLELVALADLGTLRVTAGDVDAGMALLDEAMAGAMAGESRRLDTVVFSCCSMLAACGRVGDLERAREWCAVADRFMERYGCPFLFARCRTHHGEVLLATGSWTSAEDEFRTALDMSEDAGPGPREEAIAHLAHLKARQGRFEEAEALVATIGDDVVAAIPAADICLARGDAAAAIAILERRRRELGEEHVGLAPVLSKLVDAHLASGDTDRAKACSADLARHAATGGNSLASPLAARAFGRIAATEGNREEARRHLEDAIGGSAALDRPYETARVRLDLAQMLAGSEPATAVREARRALAVFDRLGAARYADIAAALLRGLGSDGRPIPRRPGALTRREREVLGLLGLGLSNPEIAERLVISRKTVAHHVSRTLAKLGLRNRAEAVAYVAREGNKDRA